MYTILRRCCYVVAAAQDREIDTEGWYEVVFIECKFV